MLNISFSEKFTSTKDSGERTIYWKEGLPYESGSYLVTIENKVEVLYYEKDTEIFYNYSGTKMLVTAFAKLPSAYRRG